jgi:SAM-dependent methyltransferase
MKVFLGWSGARSEKVAAALYDWLERLFLPIELYVSFEEDPGKRWQAILAKNLLDAEFGILCMTPGNIISPWILYEAGALSKQTLCPYLYAIKVEDLPEQLKQFGTCTADEIGTHRLFTAITNQLREKERFERKDALLEERFKQSWPALEQKLNAIDARDVATKISERIAEAQPRFWKTLEEFKGKRFFQHNTFYRSLLAKYLDDCRRTLTVSNAYFDVPYTLYPSYLIALLDELKPTVKAIAIVDVYEHFWRQKEGEMILKQTPEDSTRVFVFDKPELLHANLDLLRRHSEKYNVYVLSLTALAAERPDKCYDFSLIGSTEMTLLAKYESAIEEGLPIRQIRFWAMSPEISPEISRHEKAIADIISVAFRVEKDGSWQMPLRLQKSGTYPVHYQTDIESLSDAVFRRDFISLPRKQVEMSTYIDVLKYDKYERQHPYYEEMMSKMIAIINSREKRGRRLRRILEFGAGTGIFTTLLLQLPSVHVTALEIDWACFHILKQNVQHMAAQIKERGSTYDLLHNDSRDTNPEGAFDFIVSSFADHHIHPLDKRPYFRNVRRNLGENAIYIVGDEFLPEYDIANEPDRRKALNVYHDHIIEIASQAGHRELVELEEEARISGLTSKGDYKLSPTHYESLVKDAALRVISSHKIGPLDPSLDNVGGIYVYEIEAENR